MYILIRDFVTQATIVKDPYNPGKPLFFKDMTELIEFISEGKLKDYLIAVVDPIYMDGQSFTKLVNSKHFETTFKREEKYSAKSSIRYPRHIK